MRQSKIFVTVDAVTIRRKSGPGELLLIKRKNDPFKGSWALPGGFVDEGEDLEEAARRELEEETGLKADTMEQLKAFGKPGRDPRHHTVSVAFLCYVPDNAEAAAADDAAEADWFPVDKLPELAFDHRDIINYALTKLS
ncbi:MAG TPA: NUDIX hydrolase [Flavobacterium sp.]|jgi:8-oxo-dGTP diphosphatase